MCCSGLLILIQVIQQEMRIMKIFQQLLKQIRPVNTKSCLQHLDGDRSRQLHLQHYSMWFVLCMQG